MAEKNQTNVVDDKAAAGGAVPPGTITEPKTTLSAPVGPAAAALVDFEPVSDEVTRAYVGGKGGRTHAGTITHGKDGATFMPVAYTFIGLAELKEIVAVMEEK